MRHQRERQAKVNSTSYGAMSIGSSVAGSISILLVWVAGSPQFGMFSQAWKAVGVMQLVALSVAMCLVSVTFYCNINHDSHILRPVSLGILITSSLPLLAFVAILIARILLNAG